MKILLYVVALDQKLSYVQTHNRDFCSASWDTVISGT